MNKVDTLFSAPINSITLADIEEFCSYKIKECETLDYKQEINNQNLGKIVDTIAAMANTDGGIILVGVPEEKNEKGNQGIPSSVEGYTPVVKNSIFQQISNVCRANLQPPYIPEMIDIPLEGTDKIVLLIRINRDSLPQLPLYHRESGIKVRSGEDVKFATPAQIKLLMDESSVSKPIFHHTEHRDLMANSPQDMNWLSIALSVPQKRFSKPPILSTNDIRSILHTVDNHSIADQKTWMNRYYPARLKNFSSPESLASEFVRSAYTLDLLPRRNHQIRAGIDQKWYNLHFSSMGVFTALIGFENHNEKKPFGPESIASAIQSAIDLLSNPVFRKIYPNLLWDGNCSIWFKLSIYEGILNKELIPFNIPSGIISPLSTNEGIVDFRLGEMLSSEKAKEITAYLLAQFGCWDYEIGLTNLDLTNNLY